MTEQLNRSSQVEDYIRGLWQEEKAIVLDGSKGYPLSPRARRNNLPLVDLLNLYRPDSVAVLTRDFREAGAVGVQTNTFCSNRYQFEIHGRSESVEKVNRLGAEIARDAVGDLAFVIGSMGPTGMIVSDKLASRGVKKAISFEQAVEAFNEQAKGLLSGGVDVFGPETHSNPQELLAAIAGIRSALGNEDRPIIATVTFRKSPKSTSSRLQFDTEFGLTPAKLVSIADEKGILAYGANCGFGTRGITGLVRSLLEEGGIVVAKFNKGSPRLVHGITVYPNPNMAAYGVRMYELGATLIGACCGSTVEDIEQIAIALDKMGVTEPLSLN